MKNNTNNEQHKLRNIIRDIVNQQMEYIQKYKLNPQLLKPEYVRINNRKIKSLR
jgi:hypothetical protein